MHSREQQGLSSGHWLLLSQVWAQAVDAKSEANRIEEPRRTILNERMYSNAIDQTEVYILWKTKELGNGCSDVRKKKRKTRVRPRGQLLFNCCNWRC